MEEKSTFTTDICQCLTLVLQTMHDAMVANRVETVDYIRSTQNYRLNRLITLRLSLHRTELFTVASILFPVPKQTVLRHFGTGPEVSRHFGTIRLVPKCLGTEMSWYQSVLLPQNAQKFMSPSVKFYMKGSNSLVCKARLVNLHIRPMVMCS